MRNASMDVDDYIASAPKEVQGKLREMRAAIRQTAPTAAESISYRMPYYNYHGQLAWFGYAKSHIGLYLRPPIIQNFKQELARFETTKSAIHFPLDQPLPIPLVKKLVRARMKINESEK